MKIIVALLLWSSSALLAGCGAERAHAFAMVKPSEMCVAESVACTRSHDCCSQWCVNGSCERREP